MGKKIVIGNWKMNKGVAETQTFLRSLKKNLPAKLNTIVAVSPSFTSIPAAIEISKASSIKVVSQNVHWKREGAFTGEISPTMLKELGCKMSLVGHSERREFFCDTNQTVNKRIKCAIEFGIEVIFCIGEKLDEREVGGTKEIIEKQFSEGLEGLTSNEMKNVIIAYEPVWAIGTGKNASPDEAEEVHQFIRDIIRKKYGSEVSASISILYGGSVKPDNIESLIRQKNVDGALVGGASLDLESFSKIIEVVNAA